MGVRFYANHSRCVRFDSFDNEQVAEIKSFLIRDADRRTGEEGIGYYDDYVLAEESGDMPAVVGWRVRMTCKRCGGSATIASRWQALMGCGMCYNTIIDKVEGIIDKRTQNMTGRNLKELLLAPEARTESLTPPRTKRRHRAPLSFDNHTGRKNIEGNGFSDYGCGE